ncbi:hypothetical protein QFC19_001398 [Naganishia cerealis]|uniref:Uncharacterized protein n=1 Tax=Naganishia cerealis TaxID=610337 RepID=A0ACC2WGI5_9TREE|nr:hypothetical protein QFC19_001398 [Naganishia cerealis]
MDDSHSDADTDQAEEQLFAAVDVDGIEDGSDGEIYIAVDPEEGASVQADLSRVHIPETARSPQIGGAAHIRATSHSSVMDSQDVQPEDSTVSAMPAKVVAQDGSRSTTGVAIPAAPGVGEAVMEVNSLLDDSLNSAKESMKSRNSTKTAPHENATKDSAPASTKRMHPEDKHQIDSITETVAAEKPLGNVPMPIDAASSVEEGSATNQSRLPSPQPTVSVPQASTSTETPRTETAPSTPGHSLNRVVERKEPAVLGDFVSLAEMEGRQHLRFNSQSPEKQPVSEDNTKAEPVTEVTTTQAEQSTPSKRTFTPFTSVMGASAAVLPAPSPLSGPSLHSTSHNATSGAIATPPFSPADNASNSSRATSERRSKRSRDAVSPPVSTASETLVHSAAEDGGKKKKKKKKSKTGLEEMALAADEEADGNSSRAQRDGDKAEQTSLSASTSTNAAAREIGMVATGEDDKSRLDSASSGMIDMDIDEDSSNPGTQPALVAKPNGTATFNLDQEDFIAFDASDDEDAAEAMFPKNSFVDKGKGKASNEAMCAECGGIGSHSASCSHSVICASCRQTGHPAQYCFSSWRDYVYHTREEREAAINTKSTIAQEGGWKYEAVGVLVLDGSAGRCYNCGDTGHWGDDCDYPQWNDGLDGDADSAFSRPNATKGPFAKDHNIEQRAADPAFVQTQELEHESWANRTLNLRPGSMGRERQKQNLRRQAGNPRDNQDEEEEESWFDFPHPGAGNHVRFPGDGIRLGPSSYPRGGPPTGPRNTGGAQNRQMAPTANGKGSGFRGIQIRGLASATIGGNPSRNQGVQDQSGARGGGNRDLPQQARNTGYVGNNGGRDYQRNDRDSAADSFYSSGRGGGSVAEWESDYRRSDQPFRPNTTTNASTMAGDRFGRDRSNNDVRGNGRGNGGPRQYGNGGYGRNDPPQGRASGGGHRQNYYGGY